MRFTDIRPTVYKRTTAAENADSVATPRRLSPFLPDGVSLQSGVNGADVLRPMYNRKSRRAVGMRRTRRRLGGVALINKPWQPSKEDVAA
jgi:hypothetical protein